MRENKKLLVIGRVPAAKYRSAQLAVLHEGYNPKVVRLTPYEFYDKVVGDANANDVPLSDNEFVQVVKAAIKDWLDQLGPIAAIVMDEETHNRWGEPGTLFVVEALERRRPFQRWCVHGDGWVEQVD
jgi:hypothetical protein